MRKRLLLFILGALFFCTGLSFAQPTFTIQNKKDACDGLSNGSFEVLVSVANPPPLRVFVFGPPDQGPLAATVGVPLVISGLPGGPAPGGRSYIVVVQDADGSSVQFVSIINVATALSASVGSSSSNTSCTVPDGFIDLNVSGGSGAGYTYSWTGPNGFTSTNQDISGLAGGSYSVLVSDNGTNCTRTVGPIILTDPSPAIQTITTPSPQSICAGGNLVIDMASSEPGVTYEVIQNNSINTGIIQIGAGVGLQFTVPTGSFSNGDNFKIRASNNFCTPTDMNGIVIANIIPIPTATASGGGAVCFGAPLPNITFNFTGTAPFTFTYTVDGANPVTVNNHGSTTYTITNAPAGVYAVTALTDNFGCAATNFGSSASVVINPLPTASASGGGAACSGGTLPDVTFTFTGTAPFDFTFDNGTSATVVNDHPTNTFTIPGAAAGTYSVTALSDANGCTATALGTSVNVVVNALPTVSSATGGGTVCSGQPLPNVTFNFTGTAPFTFTYTDGTTPVTVNNHPTATYTINNAPAGAYSITALTDANNCNATALAGTVNVVVNPLPTATITGGGSACTGGTLPNVTFTFTGTAPFNFTYSNGSGSTVVNNHPTNSFTITGAPAGTYSVTALSDANTCVGTSLGVPVAVVVNPLPTVSSVTGGGTVCSGTTLPDVNFTFTGTAPFTFTYTDGSTPVTITNHPTNSFVINNATAGNYSVTALTDGNGCNATSLGGTASVVVNPLPTATVTGGGAVCTGSPLPDVTFTFTGASPFNFTYTDGTTPVNVSNHLTNTFTISGAAAGTYSITALTDANGCVGTNLGAPVAVSVTPAPTVSNVAGGGTVCAGATLPDITFTFSGTAPFTFTYTNGSTPTTITSHPSTTFTINNAPAGNYSVTALTDANACAASVLGGSVAVVVNAAPTASVSGGGTVCSGASLPSVTFTFTGTPPYNFTYTDGSTPVTINNHATNTFIINNAPAGNYSVSALSDANACVATDLGSAVPVVVNPLPSVLNVSGGGTVCSGQPLPDVTFDFAGTAPFTFTFTDGTNPTTITNHPSSTYTVSGATAGNYEVTALTDANGCNASSLGGSVAVVVDALPTTAVAGADQNICVTSTGLQGNAPVTGTGLWTIDPSGSGGVIADPSNPTSVFTGTAGQTYILRWTITNGVCPASFDQVQIAMSADATIADAGADDEECGPKTLEGNTPVSGTGLWTIESGSGGSFVDATNPTTIFSGNEGETYTLRWTITNGACSTFDEVDISFSNSATVANAGADATICNGSALQGNAPVSGSGLWTVSGGSGGSFADATNPTSSFTGTPGEVYTLTWTITSGECITTDDVTITIDNNSPPVANAGPDQEICDITTFLAGNDPTPGTGLWTIVGVETNGVFGDPTSPNSTFDGEAGKSYDLEWTISSAVPGCTPTSDRVTIAFATIPTLSNAGQNQDICGTEVTLAANTPTSGTGSWSVVPPLSGTFSDPSSPGSTFTGTAGNTYELVWTISSACGNSSSSVFISFQDLLSTPVAGPDQTVCGSATLAANTPVIGTGSWSIEDGDGGNIANAANPNTTFTGAPGETYILRWTITNGGCSASDEVTITIDPDAPTPPLAGQDQIICGTSTKLEGNTPTNGTGSWAVLSGAGFSISDTSNPVADFSGVAGITYQLRWRITSGCGFLDDTVRVTFNDLPTVPDAGQDRTVCGPTALEGNTPVTGTGLWTITGGTGGVLADPSNPSSAFSGNGGTTYTLEWTITSGTCPPGSDQVQITFDGNSPTVANAGADQTVCGGTSTLLAGNAPVVGTGQWSIVSLNTGTFADDTNPLTSFSGTAGETYILRWTITSATPGCTPSTDEVTIVFDNSAPVADAGADQPVCGPTATVNASASSSLTGTWTVVSGPGGTFTDANSAITDFTGVPGNAYVLQYTISSACGDVSDQVTVTLDENPDDAFAGNDKTICGTEQLEASPVFIGTGSWTIISGVGGVLADPLDPNSNFTGVASNVYTLRWTTSNGTCSDKTDDVDITIDANSPTIADAGTDQALCGTTTTVVGNTPVIGTGAWSVVSGSNGTFVDASSPVTDFSGDAGTSYLLRWSISAAGCANPTFDDVRVQFDDVPSVANAGPDQQGCQTSYTLAAAVPTSGTGSWTITGGTGGALADATAPGTTFTGTNGQVYTLEWTVSNTCGTSVDQVSITINDAPSVSVAGPDQVICGSVFANLAANTPTSGTGFWSIVSGAGGSVVTPSSSTSQFIGLAGTAYTLRWIIANGTCTPNFDDVIINFAASPVATSPVTVCQNAVAPALTVTVAGATSFNWYYYTDPSDPLTRTALATTTASHTPGAELNTAVVGSLTYEVEAVYSCGNSPAIQIVVNVSNTGACGGGGGNCPALTSIPITPTLTTCADPDNGGLLFTLPGSYDVTIQNEIFKTNPAHPDALNSTERGTTVDFDGLKAGKYFYTIKDLAGTVCVTDFEYTLERETIVELTSEVANQNVSCFGAFEGSVTLGAKGTTTGKYFYEFTHNGNSVSGEFTPGAPITGIPATDSEYLVIKLDETNLFSCPDTAMVRLQHLFPQITYAIAKTNVSECNGADGSITLSNVQGGNGAKQARLLKIASPDPVVIRDFEDVSNAFPALSSGSYYVEIRDENGCVISSVDDPTVISAPGAVDFTVTKVADADCINNGKSGVISIGFTAAGNYLIGIGKSQVVEPSTYVPYTYNDGDPAVFVDTLSRGSYFVFVKPATGNICASTRPTGEIEGAYAISFDVQRVCFAETQPSINLINVVGQPNAQMTIEVYRLANLSEKVDEFTVPTAETISITYQGAPAGSPHTWLIQQDTYVIKAYQNQSFCPGEPTTPSHQVTYTATQPIALSIDNIKQSLPEPRHTGGFTLRTIIGGSPLDDEDRGPYFIVSVLDPSSNTPVLDDINVFRNAQGNYQHEFRNLPVGNYLVQVTDNNGCEATTIVIVPADTRILIPNIFTPNNDTVNDFFEVVNLPEGGNHKLVITNRWGKQIFSTGDYREGNFWDAEGEPDGIYFYRLQVAGEQTYTGWVEVLRGDKP